MDKIVLNDVTSLNSLSVINDNFDKLEAELNDRVLYRDVVPGEVNSVQDDIDMNGKRIYNLPVPTTANEPIRKADLDAAILGDYGVATGVASFNTRGGDVVLTQSDVVSALGYAPMASAVTGFNTRTGSVTLTGSDVTTALSFTPANVLSPSLLGSPTAPTVTPGDNSTKLATTAFVTAAVVASTTGVASFKGRTGAVVPATNDYLVGQVYGAAPLDSPALTGTPTAPTPSGADNSTKIATTAFVKGLIAGSGVTSFNTRSGAVTLNGSDVVTALEGSANVGAVQITSTSPNPFNSTLRVKRNATYTGGTVGYVNSVLYVETEVASSATSFEWGVTSVLKNYATGGENVGGYLQGNKYSTGPTFGSVSEVCDMNNASSSSVGGSVIGTEVDVWCNGGDGAAQRHGVNVVVGNAQYIRGLGEGIGKGYATSGVWVTAANGDASRAAFIYGINVASAETASFRSNAIAPAGFGMLLEGTYAVGIDTVGSTISTGNAIRIKENDAIAFEGTGNIKMKYRNSGGNQYLEFYNGSTRRGFINVGSGADVDLAGGSGGVSGVFSFNTRTGDVSLTSGDVTGALGFSPPSLTGVNTYTGSYNQFNNIVYATGGVNVGNGSFSSSSPSNVDYNAEGSRSFAFWHRIVVDGTVYKFKVYNN